MDNLSNDDGYDEDLLKWPHEFEEIYSFNQHLETRRWFILLTFSLFR